MSATGLAFVAVFFFGLFKSITSKPIYGLYTYLLTFYLHAPANWWGKDLPDLRWSLLAALVTLISLYLHQNKNPVVWFRFRETKLYFLFVLWVWIQSFWVIDFSLHKEFVFLSLKFLVLTILIQNCLRTVGDVKGFIVANMIGCAYFGFIGLMGPGGRLENVGTADLNDSNYLAQHLAVILILGGYLLLMPFSKKHLFLGGLIVLILNAIILTQSRSAVIALAAAGIFGIFYTPSLYKKKLYLFSILAVSAFLILLGPQMIAKFQTIKGDDSGLVQQDNSAASRLEIIRAQFEMFKNNPVLGLGHRSTFLLSQQYMNESLLTKPKGDEQLGRRASHNFIMSLLVDHGSIGFILYYVVVASCFYRLFEVRKKRQKKSYDAVAHLLFISTLVGLVSLTITGLGSNSKKLEIGIWLFALAPLLANFASKGNLPNKE